MHPGLYEEFDAKQSSWNQRPFMITQSGRFEHVICLFSFTHNSTEIFTDVISWIYFVHNSVGDSFSKTISDIPFHRVWKICNDNFLPNCFVIIDAVRWMFLQLIVRINPIKGQNILIYRNLFYSHLRRMPIIFFSKCFLCIFGLILVQKLN